nr:unnamed protein product [Spirometra erinaceieuropaei]
MSPLTLAAWYVRSFRDNPRKNRREPRTEKVAQEQARYKVVIAALSETRVSKQGQLDETEDIQEYADRKEWKSVFVSIRAVYGPTTKATPHLLCAHGTTLLTAKTRVLQRWAKHFRGIPSRPSTISDGAIARLHQVGNNANLDFPPYIHETIRAVWQLSSGKAPGSDASPAEIYKHSSPPLIDHPNALLQEMWRQGEFSHDFKDAKIASLYIRKGQKASSASALTVVHPTWSTPPANIRRSDRRCKPTFDTVNHKGLGKILRKFNCPERFIQMVHQLYDIMTARVTVEGVVSETCAVTNGVRQGCVLTPTLFSLMFSAMLVDAYRDERPRTRIAYRTDGHLLNQWLMHLQSRVSATFFHELLFADDCVLNTNSEGDMERSRDLIDAASDNFGPISCTEKTVNMHQPPPDAALVTPQINVNGVQLQVVDNLTHQGNTLCHSTKIDAAVWSGDLDGVQEAGAETRSFPSHLSSMHIRNEMAGPDHRNGRES